MNRRDEGEFRAVVAALAQEYGASRNDVIAAAKSLPLWGRRGRPPIDDSRAIREALRMRRDGSARNDWEAVCKVAPGTRGNSADAAKMRVYKKLLSPRAHCPSEAVGAERPEPGAQARSPLDEVISHLRDRSVQRLVRMGRRTALFTKSIAIK